MPGGGGARNLVLQGGPFRIRGTRSREVAETVMDLAAGGERSVAAFRARRLWAAMSIGASICP